jgi:hypothetical protein
MWFYPRIEVNIDVVEEDNTNLYVIVQKESKVDDCE